MSSLSPCSTDSISISSCLLSRYVLIITIFGVFYLLVVPIVSIWFTGRDLFSVGEVLTSLVWGEEYYFQILPH